MLQCDQNWNSLGIGRLHWFIEKGAEAYVQSFEYSKKRIEFLLSTFIKCDQRKKETKLSWDFSDEKMFLYLWGNQIVKEAFKSMIIRLSLSAPSLQNWYQERIFWSNLRLNYFWILYSCSGNFLRKLSGHPDYWLLCCDQTISYLHFRFLWLWSLTSESKAAFVRFFNFSYLTCMTLFASQLS